jgi:hypothetical protein
VNRSVRLVLPPVWPGVFRHSAQLFAGALEELGLVVEAHEVEASPTAALNVLLGWSLYEPEIPPSARYVIHQSEPLSVDPWPERAAERQTLFDRAVEIWDYSDRHLQLYRPHRARWMPLRYHPALWRSPSHSSPPWDILFIGQLSPRRRLILERLANRCAVTALPRWDHELEAAIARSKIVLNIHRSDAETPLEQPRISHALHGGAFVLTEDAADRPYEQLPTAPWGELEEAAVYHLFNARERDERRDLAVEAFRTGPLMTDTVREALSALEVLPC